MGDSWASDRKAAGKAHRPSYREGMRELGNPLGQPSCRLCGGRIEGELVSVAGTTKGSSFYHGYCYEDRWAHIMHRLR